MSTPVASRFQRGAAAVELAVILSATTILMLPALALCVFTFYQFSVIKTAGDDAAAYVASIPRAAFVTNVQRQNARNLASQMVANAVLGAGITENTAVNPALVWCPGVPVTCNSVVPAFIGVDTYIELDVMGFDMLYPILPDSLNNKISYTARSIAPYAN